MHGDFAISFASFMAMVVFGMLRARRRLHAMQHMQQVTLELVQRTEAMIIDLSPAPQPVLAEGPFRSMVHVPVEKDEVVELLNEVVVLLAGAEQLSPTLMRDRMRTIAARARRLVESQHGT